VVKNYLRGKFGLQAYESFVVLFVDVKNRLIDAQEMFRGTLTQIMIPVLRNNFFFKDSLLRAEFCYTCLYATSPNYGTSLVYVARTPTSRLS